MSKLDKSQLIKIFPWLNAVKLAEPNFSNSMVFLNKWRLDQHKLELIKQIFNNAQDFEAFAQLEQDNQFDLVQLIDQYPSEIVELINSFAQQNIDIFRALIDLRYYVSQASADDISSATRTCGTPLYQENYYLLLDAISKGRKLIITIKNNPSIYNIIQKNEFELEKFLHDPLIYEDQKKFLQYNEVQPEIDFEILSVHEHEAPDIERISGAPSENDEMSLIADRPFNHNDASQLSDDIEYREKNNKN